MSVIAVTGSAGGMGRAIRERMESAGHRIIGVDQSEAEVNGPLRLSSGYDLCLKQEVTQVLS
jgi:nucleoside-diphosphate-sugar epimerase